MINSSELITYKEHAKHVRQKIISVADYCHERVHWASSLSCVEILVYIMSGASNFADKKVHSEKRDVLIVSKGHAALTWYAVMSELELIEEDFVKQYQQNGSNYPEELVKDKSLHIECSTGSLGLGLPYAVGMAITAKRRGSNKKIFCVMGDGECDEGSVWEAVMLAAQQKLDNVFLIIDLNGLQADGNTDDIISWRNIQNQFREFGWNALSIDGHDFNELDASFKGVADKPTVVIARTIKGKGISFMENDYLWHDRVLDKNFLEQAKMEIGI
ncbi:transketolase [Lachnospiraceae bacterium 48-42]